MINFKKLPLAAILLVVVSGVLMGCGSKKSTKDIDTVRIAFFPNITHSQALVGKAEGTFAKAFGDKITVDWKKVNAGPAEIEALFAGEVDIGYIGPGPAVNGYAKSKGDLQIIAGATNSGQILVTREALVLKDIKELSGKKIAVPQFGNTQDLTLRAILKENGLTDKTKGGDVEIVQAENPDIKTLLESGEIDAAFVPEPWGARLIDEAKANIALDEKEVLNNGDYTTAVVIARKDFINEHPELIEKFIEAHLELTDFINNNPEKAKEIVNSQIKELTNKSLSKKVLDEAYSRLTITSIPQTDSIKAFTDLAYETGFLKENPDLKDLYYLDALNKVLQAKGNK